MMMMVVERCRRVTCGCVLGGVGRRGVWCGVWISSPAFLWVYAEWIVVYRCVVSMRLRLWLCVVVSLVAFACGVARM
jgi:hypothetical protein